MADQNIILDNGVFPFVDMDHDIVLHTDALPDHDPPAVPTQHRAKPHARPRSNRHIPNQNSRRRNIHTLRHLRPHPIQLNQHRAPIPILIILSPSDQATVGCRRPRLIRPVMVNYPQQVLQSICSRTFEFEKHPLMTVIDISRTLEPALAVWPGDTPFDRRTVLAMADGAFVNLSTLTLSSHTGAHVDAPFHVQREWRHDRKPAARRLLGSCPGSYRAQARRPACA